MGLRQRKDIYGDQAPWWGEYLAQYREALKHARGARILDIGCGEGFGSRYLFDNGAVEVLGIDIDPQLIERAKDKYGRDGVEFAAQRAEELDHHTKKFDLVTCFQVLEKSTNPDQLLHQIHKILNSGGEAVISTVNRVRFSNLTEAPAEASHVAEFDEIEFKAMIKRHFGKAEFHSLVCTRDGYTKLFQNSISDRIPHSLKNTVAQKIFGSTFFPSEKEFVLKSLDSHQAPLFYAFCKKT